MDNEIPNRSQQTGGLKLMTVFIVVLALHVMVIGGITVYYLLHGESSDNDLTTDKIKDIKPVLDAANNDGALPQSAAPAPVTSAENTNAAPVATATETTPPPAVSDNAVSPADTAPDLSAPHSVIMPADHSALDATPVAPITSVHPPESMTAPSTSLYVVKAGDTLFKIAKLKNLSVSKIKVANNLTSSFLKIGQKLIMPEVTMTGEAVVNTSSTVPAQAPTDTMNGTTSILNDTPVQDTATANLLQPVATHPRVYTVMKGDTLTRIAREFKTTPDAIMTANSITDPRKLSIGTKLKIPASASRTNSANNAAKPTQTQATTAASPQLVNFRS